MRPDCGFLSSEPTEEGRPDQALSQLLLAKLYPGDSPIYQVQGDIPWGGHRSGVQGRPWKPRGGPSLPSAASLRGCTQGFSTEGPQLGTALPAMGITHPSCCPGVGEEVR